ncbi:MAG: hypothetical protein A3J93_02445 [Candidatus Magasanikbacteria bacterium RIFOXYC2_FULL_42_28]|uniref:Uncharacterized protein n=1 Tax=Candidatus Magasanikbacteria bacterium RIFOXYC2_FULL_42_28 TaxID=1798704 RepID=A0A1F6NVQ7_9BACT|nr:MAG: hypothetical protein A3J93_02445 [Candidatus Magasanikbacteria bacterium RIFOXYC2_FULL_42_28]
MLPNVAKNRYVNALFWLMFFSAAVHMAVLFFLTIINNNWQIINYFNILDFDLIAPNFPGLNNLTLATFTGLIIYLLIFFFGTKKNN